MAKSLKYHPHGSVLLCTFSIEEGLLLLCNPLCEAIIQSCLAAAWKRYPVHVCHMLVEATHVHLLIVVDDPCNVPHFFRLFKSESAHMLNRLLGRKKRTIWCEGYDSPMVLTPTRAVIAIAYLYANPAKDNLEISIDRYPGFSTWEMFQSGQTVKTWKRLRRYQFGALDQDSHNLNGYTREAKRLLEERNEVQKFELEPNKWMETFGYYDPDQQKMINERIVARVKLLENRASIKRAREKRGVIGRERLKHQILDLTYRPQRSGRRMWCLSDRRSIRIEFIKQFEKLMDDARSVRNQWRKGDRSAKYPPGLHPPSMPKLANVIGGSVSVVFA